MSNVIDALVAAMETGKRRKKPERQWAQLAATADGPGRRLLDAVAWFRPPTWELGSRFITAVPQTFERTRDRFTLRFPFEVARSCELGGAYADDIWSWGFAWTGGELVFAEVSKTAVTAYTCDDWFAHVRADELAQWQVRGTDPPEEFFAFIEAAGEPLPRPAVAHLHRPRQP